MFHISCGRACRALCMVTLAFVPEMAFAEDDHLEPGIYLDRIVSGGRERVEGNGEAECKRFRFANPVQPFGQNCPQTPESLTFTTGEAENPIAWLGTVVKVKRGEGKLTEACEEIAAQGQQYGRIFLGGHAGHTYEGPSIGGMGFYVTCTNGGMRTRPSGPAFEALAACLKKVMRPAAELVIASCGDYPDPAPEDRMNRRQCAAGQLADTIGHDVIITSGPCSSSGSYSYCSTGHVRVSPMLAIAAAGGPVPPAPRCAWKRSRHARALRRASES